MTQEREEHHHRGKFTEGLLNTPAILDALDIRQGQVILDAGCGNGYMSKIFSEALSGKGKVISVDTDKYFIGKLKEEAKGTLIEVIEGDITGRTDIESASVDTVYISTVMHGFSKQRFQDFVEEASRLLRPKGRLAVVEMEKKDTPFGPPVHLRYSPEELMEKIPLVPGKTISAGEHFYLQIFIKP